MKSEKTKGRKSICFGVMSLAFSVMPLVTAYTAPFCGSGNVYHKFHSFVLLFVFAAIGSGMMAIITGFLAKPKTIVVWAGIGVGSFNLIFVMTFVMFLCSVSSERFPLGCRMVTLSSATQKYCEQNEGYLPDAEVWCDQLLKSVKNVKGFSTGTFSGRYRGTKSGLNKDNQDFVRSLGEKRSGFAFNKNLDEFRISDINRKTVLLFETDLGWNQNGTSSTLPFMGYGGYWPLFEDGYIIVFVGPSSTFTVKFVKNSEIDDLNWEPVE